MPNSRVPKVTDGLEYWSIDRITNGMYDRSKSRNKPMMLTQMVLRSRRMLTAPNFFGRVGN